MQYWIYGSNPLKEYYNKISSAVLTFKKLAEITVLLNQDASLLISHTTNLKSRLSKNIAITRFLKSSVKSAITMISKFSSRKPEYVSAEVFFDIGVP